MGDQDGRKEQAGCSVRALLAKARVATDNAVDEPTALRDIENGEALWSSLQAVVPPYDPDSLLNYIELTPHLAPCIGAYVQNIEGYGHQAVPVEPWMEDLDAEEATEAIRNALAIEAWAAAEEAARGQAQRKADAAAPPVEPPAAAPDDTADEGGEGGPTDEEVDAAREAIRAQMQRDRYLYDAWFKNCCSEMSFGHLRRITRADYESFGWACWEMLRDATGTLKRIAYVPGHTVRPLVDKGEQVEVTESDALTPLSKDREIIVHRAFRVYVQIVQGKRVYFKSPGDPRIISRTTGRTYPTVAAMRADGSADPPGEGKDAQPANELMWFAQHSPRTPCPPPRWIGTLLRVLGVREADETNYYYLNGNSIPPALLMVSGGSIPRGIKERLEARLESEFRGPGRNHRVLVIEAIAPGRPSERTMLPTLEYQSLRDARQTDALFTVYDERAADAIGASFRLPPLLRGYTPASLNRATAIASLEFAEQQVFQPEREDIDWSINKYLLPEIGVKYLACRSNSPPTRSPEEVGQLVRDAAPYGGLLPYEIRQLMGDVLNRPLTKVEEPWAFQPMAMTLAGLAGPGGVGMGTGEAPAALAPQIDGIERRVAEIVTAELRSAGLEYDVSARLFGPRDARPEPTAKQPPDAEEESR